MSKKAKQKQKKKVDKTPVEKRPFIDFSKPIESPLESHDGYVQFEPVLLPRVYRKWRDAQTKRLDAGKLDYNPVVVAKNPDGLVAFDTTTWGEVLAVCDIHLDTLPDGALTDTTGESTPHLVMAWLIPLAIDCYFPQYLVGK